VGSWVYLRDKGKVTGIIACTCHNSLSAVLGTHLFVFMFCYGVLSKNIYRFRSAPSTQCCANQNRNKSMATVHPSTMAEFANLLWRPSVQYSQNFWIRIKNPELEFFWVKYLCATNSNWLSERSLRFDNSEFFLSSDVGVCIGVCMFVSSV